MRNAHHLSDALFAFIYKAITTRNYWIVFPNQAYFLQKDDLHCFSSREAARAFETSIKENNQPIKIIYAPSVLSAYQQIEGLHQQQSKELLIAKNLSTMNEQNFEYLKDNLKYLGFGESLAVPLREQMAKGATDFQLTFETEINKKAFAAVLNFRKSDNTDMYFVNSYHATLQRSNGDIFDQAFYLNKGKGVTAKEAYNLLEGRAVYKELENKEGQKYHAWIQLDFSKRDKSNNHEVKQFHDAYGYDLKASLQKFNMRDIKEPDLADILIQSLKKGNLHAVAMEKEGGAVRMFVEANPQYKSVNLYDEGFHRIPKEELQKYQSQNPEKAKDQNQNETLPENSKKKNGKEVRENSGKQIKNSSKVQADKPKQGLLPKREQTAGLIEKKKSSTNKGLHL
jgi:hypothetical protein